MPPERWRELWAAVEPHAVDPGALGDYVALLLQRGPTEAARAFPEVAAHLATGCASCQAATQEIATFLRADDSGGPLGTDPPSP